ncbi:hypothetical protein V2J09_006889 [Rumex salicifolius]
MGAKFLLISQIFLGFLQLICCNDRIHLFDSIYQFGDSLTDTGNLIREDPNTICSKPPHGLDLYDRPTGRCSNGLLMIDFYAKALGLQLINPWKAEGADFSHGVNFAVGGATALDPDVLAEKSITDSPTTNSSLSVQVEWFRQHLRSICSFTAVCNYGGRQECKQKLSRALILMGEIGANDYNYPLYKGKTVEALYAFVPLVVDSIKTAVQEIIDMGASLVVVPGDFPIGCMPLYLSYHQSNATAVYDDLHCLHHFNEFAVFHNNHLLQAINHLRRLNPSVTVIYSDNYHPFRRLLQNVASLGRPVRFDEDQVFIPCCGKVEENYNCDASKGAQWCEDPRKRVFWDGTHPTQEAYRLLTEWSLVDMFNMKVLETCYDLPANGMVSSVKDAI